MLARDRLIHGTINSYSNHDCRCTECKQANSSYRSLQYRKDKDKFTNWTLLKNYGITLAERNELLLSQDNACAICRTSEVPLKQKFHVDHNHETGEIRGILCGACNIAIGYLKEDISILEAAIKYLKKEG